MSHLYIFTLSWNGADKLEKLKESLIPCLQNFNWTWLIKDNGSKDNSVELVNSWNDPNIKVIPYKDNSQNFSQGMNFLYQEASPKDEDYVLLLNNDVIFNDKKSINNMVKIMDQDPDVGVVGARLLFTGTNLLQHAGVVFNPAYHAPTHFRLKQSADQLSEKNREFQVVTGAVLLTKSEYYKQACTTNKSGIPGMDENYHWAFDDVDFCLSIKYNLNKKIVYCGKTNIFHEEGASLKKNPANKLFMRHNLDLLRGKWSSKMLMDQGIYDKQPRYNLYKEV